jgi:hypothetical protein
LSHLDGLIISRGGLDIVTVRLTRNDRQRTQALMTTAADFLPVAAERLRTILAKDTDCKQ